MAVKPCPRLNLANHYTFTCPLCMGMGIVNASPELKYRLQQLSDRSGENEKAMDELRRRGIISCDTGSPEDSRTVETKWRWAYREDGTCYPLIEDQKDI